MELVYLWVENYKNIQNQGFNFSPKFDCKFYDEYDEKGKLKDNCKLEIKKNDDYIENFFGDNINVTAIVGKNGSGKSSVCDQVILSMVNNQNTLLIVKIQNKYYCLHRYPNPQTFTIFSKIKVDKVSEMNLIDIMYLETEKQCPPISSDLIKDIEQPSAVDEISDLIYIDSYSDEYRNNNRIELSSDKFGLYALKLYRSEFKNIKNVLFDFSISYFHIVQNNRYLYDLLYETSFINLDKQYERKYWHLRLNIYDMYLCHIFLHANMVNHFFDKCIYQNNNGYEKYLIDYQKAYSILNDNNIEILVYKKEFEEFEDYLAKNDGDISIEDVVNMDENLLQFYTFSAYDKNNRGYHDLSYGEKNILSQIISIYYKVSISDKDFILIVLDEPDIALHPSWQKKYLSQISNFLSHSSKHIHLLLSSHSPFLLSDIPKQNIIFLDTDEEGNCKVVDGLKEKKQTFGANIHTLLSDSFFMEDGLMGEFAKGKINEIIEFHKEVEENKKKKSNCFSLRRRYLRLKTKFWQTQSIIGEDYLKQVIRNHLVEIEKILLGKNIAKKEEITRTKKYLKSLEDE